MTCENPWFGDVLATKNKRQGPESKRRFPTEINRSFSLTFEYKL